MSVTNVLVVDDDIAICRIVHRMLSDDHRKVQISQSVASAHDAIEQTPFDVYVLDYKLPDGSGLDVAEWIRLKRGAAPIIFMSGYDPSAVALRAEELCIADFLKKKPFSSETLCNAVKRMISSQPPAQASVPQNQETQKKQQNLISRSLARF
jgi:two-component system, NtrC family, response regulator HydG